MKFRSLEKHALDYVIGLAELYNEIGFKIAAISDCDITIGENVKLDAKNHLKDAQRSLAYAMTSIMQYGSTEE